MISFSLSEILADSKLSDLLCDNSGECVFDTNLEFKPECTETPVVKLCKEVKAEMTKHQNDTSVDITNCFDWIFKPPYGYIMTDSSMAALGLAFRPYINKMFITSTSTMIDSLKLVTFVSDLMDYFLGSKKDNTDLHIRFSSQEERDLMDVLINTFSLDRNENDGLLNIKWNLRDKFKQDNKAPLWVLKYVPKENNKLASVFDDLFEFTQKQNDDIDSKIVSNLLAEIKDKRLDIVNAINEVKKADCLSLFVSYQLHKEGHPELDVNKCISILKSDLSGEVIFWNEKDMKNSIRKYIDDEINPKFEPNIEKEKEFIDNSNPIENLEDMEKLLKKLEDATITKEKLLNVLITFADKRPAYVKELLDLLDEEN